MPLRNNEQPLGQLPLLDLVNRKTLAEYIHRQELRQLQECSIEDKVWRVYCLLKFLDWKDARAITKADLEDYIIHRRKTVAPRTLQGDMIELRIFFRFLDPAKETEFFPEDERIQKPKIKFPDPLTREDIEALAAACDTMRDRALVMFLWDTGCRIDEALSRNVGDIRFDQYGGMVKVSGKTGERELWLIDCVPALQAWVNAHPQKTDPDAPLFVTYTRYGFGSRRLNVRTVQNLCKVLKKRSGVTGRVHPHGFRHARATDRAKEGFTEMESPDHVRVVENLRDAGHVHPSFRSRCKEEDPAESRPGREGAGAGSRPLDPIKCPRCGLLNPKGFYTCSRCNSPLSADAMREIGIVQNLMSNPDDLIAYAEWRKSQLIK